MTIALLFQALLMTYFVRHAGSALSLYAYSSVEDMEINGLDVNVDIECNSNFSLVCEVKPYSGSAIWEINGINAALCLKENCFEYPPFPTNHKFSMNTSTGEFTITISPVTFATNGNTYKCDDSLTARSVKGVVKAFPTDDTLRIDTSEERRVTVTTGCVYPKNETDLSFDWFLSKNRINPEKKETLSNVSNSSVFDCAVTSCAGLQTAYFNNTVEFEVFDEGDSYYICVKVTHIDAESRAVEICSDGQFILKEKTCEKNDKVRVLRIIMITGWSADGLLITLHVIVLFTNLFLSDMLNKRITGKERYLHWTCFVSIVVAIPILVSFVVFTIYYPQCYRDSCSYCQWFKKIGPGFISYVSLRFLIGISIIVLEVTCSYKEINGIEDLMEFVKTMKVYHFERAMYFLPPFVNIIIPACCWIGIYCIKYVGKPRVGVSNVNNDGEKQKEESRHSDNGKFNNAFSERTYGMEIQTHSKNPHPLQLSGKKTTSPRENAIINHFIERQLGHNLE